MAAARCDFPLIFHWLSVLFSLDFLHWLSVVFPLIFHWFSVGFLFRFPLISYCFPWLISVTDFRGWSGAQDVDQRNGPPYQRNQSSSGTGQFSWAKRTPRNIAGNIAGNILLNCGGYLRVQVWFLHRMQGRKRSPPAGKIDDFLFKMMNIFNKKCWNLHRKCRSLFLKWWNLHSKMMKIADPWQRGCPEIIPKLRASPWCDMPFPKKRPENVQKTSRKRLNKHAESHQNCAPESVSVVAPFVKIAIWRGRRFRLRFNYRINIHCSKINIFR